MEKQNKDKIVEAICFSLRNSWISWRIPKWITFRQKFWLEKLIFTIKVSCEKCGRLKILKQFLDEFHFIRFPVRKTDGSANFFTFYIVTIEFLYVYKYFSSFHLVNCSSTKFQMWLYVRRLLYHAFTYRPIFFSVSDSSDKTKGRAYLLKKKVLPRWDSNRGTVVKR